MTGDQGAVVEPAQLGALAAAARVGMRAAWMELAAGWRATGSATVPGIGCSESRAVPRRGIEAISPIV